MGEFGQFGYQIDCDTPVFDAGFAVVAEAGVVNAAAGADGASRMRIAINTKDLTAGVHTVNALYKNAAGDIVALCTFKILVSDENASQATAYYSASDLAAMNANNAQVSAGDGYAHFVTGGELKDKDNPSITLTADGEGFSDFIVIKYRTNCANYGSNYWGILKLNDAGDFIGNRKGSDNWFKYDMDNEWHILVLDMRRNKASNSAPANVDVVDGADITSITYNFFDYAGNSGKKASSDGEAEYFDIAYIAFY